MMQIVWLIGAMLGAVLVVGGLVLSNDGYTARLCTVLGVAVMAISALGYAASLGLGGM